MSATMSANFFCRPPCPPPCRPPCAAPCRPPCQLPCRPPQCWRFVSAQRRWQNGNIESMTNQRTDGLTKVGAKDTCVSKKIHLMMDYEVGRHLLTFNYRTKENIKGTNWPMCVMSPQGVSRCKVMLVIISILKRKRFHCYIVRLKLGIGFVTFKPPAREGLGGNWSKKWRTWN